MSSMTDTPTMRVAVVMPPLIDCLPSEALDRWRTFTLTMLSLRDTGEVEVIGLGRSGQQATEFRNGIEYRFSTTWSALTQAAREWNPDVIHIHGLGWSRLILRLARALPSVPIVVQHHGEQPWRGRARLGHRVVRRKIRAYLFTGANDGQAQAWIDAGVIRPQAQCLDVLEAASTLPEHHGSTDIGRQHPSLAAPFALSGSPSILVVGRLVADKDPLTAVRAFERSSGRLEDAHLHLLATDRTMEPDLRRYVSARPSLSHRVHLHPPVPATEMSGWYLAADIYLSASRHEGSNYSLIEALGFGCAPAVSDIASHRAIVGTLAPCFAVGDIDGAADVLVRAAGLARRTVIEHAERTLSWSVVARQLIAAYRVAGAHHGP